MLQSPFSHNMLRREALQRIREVRRKHRVRAPEFPDDNHWLNAPALTMASLRGKVVLLDFWTYCCINCLHILPDLEFLEEKYMHSPFVVIGVHSGKFPNEQDPDNIKEAVLRHAVAHPVIVDEDLKIWDLYSVKAWPTLVLIDPEGYIIATFTGEGNREVLDAYISAALEIYRSEQMLNYVPPAMDLESNYHYSQLLSYPMAVCADAAGKRIFIADTRHHRIVICDSAGEVQEIIGAGKAGLVDGDYRQALLQAPQGMAIKGEMLYVADAGNHAIRRIDLQQKSVETLAGTGVQGRGSNGGAGRETALNSPWDVVVLGDDLYIAMAGNHQIWRLRLNDHSVTQFAGSGREARRDDELLLAMFAQPAAICSDGKRYLFVADSESSSIRQIDLQTGMVETIGGGDLFVFGDQDGPRDVALLQHPMGLAWQEGSLFIADTYNHKIKKLDFETLEIYTFSGNERGFVDGQTPAFFEPAGICISGQTLLVADTNNHQVRSIDLHSRAAHTLSLEGYGEVLARQLSGAFLGKPAPMEEVSLPLQRITAGSPLTVTARVYLPDGHAFNGGSPFEYSVQAEKRLFRGDSLNQIISLPAPRERLDIRGTTGDIGETGSIFLEMRYFYCSRRKESLCLLRTVLYHIPVELVADGVDKITIDDRAE